jgi:hypothetical protein
VLSQLNKHELALNHAMSAVILLQELMLRKRLDASGGNAEDLMDKAYELCQLFVQLINQRREQQAKRQRQRRSSAVSGAQSIDEEEGTYLGNNLSPYGAKNQSLNQINNNISQQSLQQRSI